MGDETGASAEDEGPLALVDVVYLVYPRGDFQVNHTPVPEGMSVLELWGLLETIITDVEDGGKEQFREVKQRVMVNGRDALTEDEVVAINATVENFRENMLEENDANYKGPEALGGLPTSAEDDPERPDGFWANSVSQHSFNTSRDRSKRPSPLSLMRKIQSLRLPHWGKRKP